MPRGIPYIISNEAAERFSFYGMKAALAVFLANYLEVLGGESMSETKATAYVSFFTSAVYVTPLIGALIADIFFGKYRTIITLSIVYCLGHLCLAFMGINGAVELWLLAGLGLIAIGAGGIKPCVSAHVGDQFGKNNQHLLTKAFNIFYFSINFGAIISNILIPWLLKWYGPHIAFGVPGVLMALATVVFWMGRHQFIHVPANAQEFKQETLSREGLLTIAKLIPLFAFVAVFWCLFDQTATTLVFQAENMDLNLLGFEILPSQIQAANPFLILILIPLFTWVIYPLVNRYIPLTPLRKVGTGLFLMVISFAVISFIQEAIDRGESPTVVWQLLAYLIFTTAEILISIVCLEFAYTQSPRKMKSFIMSIFLVSVAAGNSLTGIISNYIQIPEIQLQENETHAGFDGVLGTKDDLILKKDTIESAAQPLLRQSASTILHIYGTTDKFPHTASANKALSGIQDPWGHNLRYTLLSASSARISSRGPDGIAGTKWDLGVIIEVNENEDIETNTWLYKQKLRLGMVGQEAFTSPIDIAYYAGGQTKLEGAAYFWFFTKFMLITAVIFIPFSIFYQPKTYLQE